jgi:hypothetical protein
VPTAPQPKQHHTAPSIHVVLTVGHAALPPVVLHFACDMPSYVRLDLVVLTAFLNVPRCTAPR